MGPSHTGERVPICTQVRKGFSTCSSGPAMMSCAGEEAQDSMTTAVHDSMTTVAHDSMTTAVHDSMTKPVHDSDYSGT